MPTLPSVVVTLVHGTILFARWPRVLALLRTIGRFFSQGTASQPAWYEDGSAFVTGLKDALAGNVRITRYIWSGGNSVWDRIWAAGAEGDFGLKIDVGRPPSLRDHIANIAKEHPGAAQVLVAHSHGGNVCLYALRDAATRNHVRGLVCLSTPFVHARLRPDGSTLIDMLKGAGALAYLALFLVASIALSNALPNPWDDIVFVSAWGALLVTVAVFRVLGEKRRQALRAWAESIAEKTGDGPETLVLLSDGDEALLALKVAEGLTVLIRGLWLATYWLPSRTLRAIEKAGRWRLPAYGVLSLIALVALLLTDATSPWGGAAGEPWTPGLALRFLGAAAMIPLMLYFALALALALPAFTVLLLAYPFLMFSRWLAFGWGGSVDMDITAETCPLGTATTTRLAAPEDARGLRHAHSYNHPDAARVVADFIARVAGTGGAAV